MDVPWIGGGVEDPLRIPCGPGGNVVQGARVPLEIVFTCCEVIMVPANH